MSRALAPHPAGLSCPEGAIAIRARAAFEKPMDSFWWMGRYNPITRAIPTGKGPGFLDTGSRVLEAKEVVVTGASE
jgi:hypothetical protein